MRLRKLKRLSGRASALSNQFTHIVRLVFDFGLASVAIPRTIMDNRMPAALQERLEAPLIAICTNCMGWFAVLHSLFRNEGEKASPQVLQFVALLICIPCFQCSHFFFKLAYVLNQRRLLRLCGEDFPLEVYKHRHHRVFALLALEGGPNFSNLNFVQATASAPRDRRYPMKPMPAKPSRGSGLRSIRRGSSSPFTWRWIGGGVRRGGAARLRSVCREKP